MSGAEFANSKGVYGVESTGAKAKGKPPSNEWTGHVSREKKAVDTVGKWVRVATREGEEGA